jgi:hypothetical protein
VSELAPAMFWMFVAAIIVAAIWRKTTLQREALATIRAAIEKGQPYDSALVEKLLRHRPENEDGMLTGGLTTIAAGAGLMILGVFLSAGEDPQALYPLLGVGVLVALIGVALLVGQWLETRRRRARSR